WFRLETDGQRSLGDPIRIRDFLCISGYEFDQQYRECRALQWHTNGDEQPATRRPAAYVRKFLSRPADRQRESESRAALFVRLCRCLLLDAERGNSPSASEKHLCPTMEFFGSAPTDVRSDSRCGVRGKPNQSRAADY